MTIVSGLRLLVLTTLLAGCSLFGDDDNAEPPAKLESFDEQVRLETLWQNDTGSGTDRQFVRLAPAVDGDRVFAADREGTVFAFGLDDGKRQWKQDTDAVLSAGPGVGEGLVLLGTSDGEVIALDIDSGELRWRVAVSSEVLSVPRADRGVVAVQTVDGAMAGLDAATGEQLWIESRTVPVLTLRGTATPLVESGAVIAGFSTGKMAALDIRTGRHVWDAVVAVPSGRSELQRIVDIDASPVIRDNVLYAGSFQGQVAAIDLRSGRALWNRDMSVYAGIAVDAAQIYLSDEQSEVWALDRRSGGSLWKQSALRHRALTGPTVVSGYLAVGDFAGYLHLLSRQDGSLVGRKRVDGDGIIVAPVALGNRLLVQGAGGKLVLYALQTQQDDA